MNRYRRKGSGAAFKGRLVGILRHRLNIRIYGIYTRQHSPQYPVPATDPKVTYTIYDANNQDELIDKAASPDLLLPEEFIRSTIGKGDACAATLIDGKLVAYDWSAFSPTHDSDGVYISFPDTYRYGYNAFTLPEFRGQHLMDGIVPLRDAYCLARGCPQSIFYIAIDNLSSARGSLRRASKRIGTVVYYRQGKRFWCWRSMGVRKTGMEFNLA